ncbi:membrane protein [Ceratobasidium sp. AG-Ba]|nr:membrane protein [Ceratobasidium sp. AG-Ba]
MRLLAAAAIGLAWAGTTGATPNSVPFEDCTSSQTLAESRYNPAEQINVTSVYAQIADVGDGHGEQLRLSFLAQMGKELVGFSNTTNYSTTLIYTTSIATFTVFTNRTFFCLNAVPPAPTPPQPYTDTSCVIPAGELAFGIATPIKHPYQLVTLNTRVQILDTSNPAKELACIDVGVTPIEDTGVGGSFDVAGVLFWTSVGLAIGYWVVVGAARIAAAWRRGSWDSNQRWVYIRWAGTVLASAISGERLAASPALLRFATPSMRDIIFHTQWCACLAMVAVEWPTFVYPILSNTAWAHLLYNVTIIQGADSNLEHWWPLRTPLYDPPSTFSDQLANKSSPLYIDASAPNTLFTFPSYPTDTARGIPALAAAVGLREQDLFGMCVTTFLVIVGSALVVSVFIWAVDWLISSVVNGGRSGATRGVRGPVVVNPANASAPADRDVKDVHFATGRSPSPESQLFPTATRGLGGGHARRGWWRYRLGQSSFHGSVLHGNLVRLLLLFHLPVTIFSCYQFTLGRSTATKLSVILASLTFAVFSVSIPMFLIYRVMRTPTGKLYDATRTLLSLGPLYNHYGHGSQLFAGLFFANNIAVGSVIGAGQKSGTAQSIIILVIEVASALATSIWLPWGKGAHMSAVSFLFCVLRIIGSVLLVILSPAVAIGDSAGAWIAFAILIIIAIIYVMFILILVCKILEGLVRLFWSISFDRSHHSVDSGLMGALGQAGCCGARQRRRRSRGHRYRLSGSQSGSSNSKAGLTARRPSTGLDYPSVDGLAYTSGNGNGMSYPPGPSNVVPAPQSYLRPEQAWQPYREADDDEGGYIMQSWHQQPHNNAQPGYPTAQQGGYQAVPTQPPPASTSGSSGFSRVKGGRAHYDSPFAIRTPARPSPLSSQVHLPPGARPPEVVGGGTGMSKHARTRSQTAVVEDATQPVPLPPSVLPPPVITADDEDSPASSEPVRRRFWFGRGGGAGSDSQDDGSSGVTGAGAGGKTSLWPFGKRRRGSEADLDFGVGDEDGGKSSGFVVTRRGRGGPAAGDGSGSNAQSEESAAPTSSFSVIRQPRPGTGDSNRRQSTVA